MKRVINSLFVLVLLTVSFSVFAQETQQQEGSLSDIALKKTHRDNWYVSIGPSANIMFGEQDQLKSPFSRLKFGGEFSVGKWFNPNTGLSLNIVGGGLRGFNLTAAPFETGYYTSQDGHIFGQMITGVPGHPMGGPFRNNGTWNNKYTRVMSKDGREGFWQDFKFVTPTVDVMGNITNLFRGHAVTDDWFNLVGFIGLGANLSFSNGYSNPNFWWLAGRVGLRANFNLTKNFAIYLEPAAYATDPEFDGYKGTAVGDLYTTMGLGIQYTFNRNVSSFETMTVNELDRLNRRVNENRDLIENHQDILERQQALLDKLGNRLASPATEKTVIVQKEAASALPGFVRFGLDSYVIEKYEYHKITEAVDFLQSNSDAKLLLVGYADRKTGNPTYNLNLSRKRVDAVKNELIKNGINPNRITTEYRGDKEQPFGVNEWNRVVMMIEKR